MNLLSIAGSDPSGGAGIQGDTKTFSKLGAYGFTVTTAITAQNTKEVLSVQPLSSKIVGSQIDSIFNDFKIDAIKIGMVYNSEIIRKIHSKLKKIKKPIVVDPIVKSTTGGLLLKKNAMPEFKKLIVPLASIITPNVIEAQTISQIPISEKNDLVNSATKIKKMGAKNVVITGFSPTKDEISDFLFTKEKKYFFSRKLVKKENHGGGCTFSAAITFALASGMTVKKAVEFARKISFESIQGSIKIGKGIQITNIKTSKEKSTASLGEAIEEFCSLQNCFKLIPECQTNFVFSEHKPKSLDEILGVEGRIVRAGQKVIVAGNLKYGASKHVASALLTVSRKFSKINSAINIKYDKKFLKIFQKNGLQVKSYDRKKEPKKIKNKESNSISWGINQALRNQKIPPDVIYHNGDWGKEPMIIIFAQGPKNILKKIAPLL